MNADYMRLLKHAEERAALDQEWRTLAAEYGAAKEDLSRARSEIGDARNALDGIGAANAKDGERMRERVATLQKTVKSAEERADALRERLDAIDREIETPLTATPAAVQAHAAAVQDCKTLCARLEAGLSDYNARLAAEPWSDPRPALERERSDILAAIALAEAGPDALSAFDKAHAATIRKAEAQAARLAETLADTVAARDGIARKLDAAKSEEQRLEALTRIVNVASLNARIAAADRDYIAAAEAAGNARARMIGLRELVQIEGGRSVELPKPPPAVPLERAVQSERTRCIEDGAILT